MRFILAEQLDGEEGSESGPAANQGEELRQLDGAYTDAGLGDAAIDGSYGGD